MLGTVRFQIGYSAESTNQKPPNFKNIRQKHDLTSFFIPVFGTIVDAGGFIKDSAFPVPVPNLKPDELLLLLVSVVVAPNLNPAPVIDPPRLGTTAAALGLGLDPGLGSVQQGHSSLSGAFDTIQTLSKYKNNIHISF